MREFYLVLFLQDGDNIKADGVVPIPGVNVVVSSALDEVALVVSYKSFRVTKA